MPQTTPTYLHDDSALPPKKRKRKDFTFPSRQHTIKFGLPQSTRFHGMNGVPGDGELLGGQALRFTFVGVQRLLDRNAQLLRDWAHQSRHGVAECPPELENNLTDLCAAAIHDGANDFFPMRPGNVEIGGRGIPEPTVERRNPAVGADLNNKIAEVELKILSDLRQAKVATGKQLRYAIAVALQQLIRLYAEGRLNKRRRQVRDILLRILTVNLTPPRAQKRVKTLLAALLIDIRKGALAPEKYRAHLDHIAGIVPDRSDSAAAKKSKAAARGRDQHSRNHKGNAGEAAQKLRASKRAATAAKNASPSDPRGVKDKLPFVVNGNSNKNDFLVKVWLPDTMVQKLRHR